MLGGGAVLTGLLAIPPFVAAARCSLPEAGVVGVACVALAVLSGLWNQNFGSDEYVVEVLTVIAGVVAALWLSSLRTDLYREQQAAELLAEGGALMEDALDRTERAHHLADLAVPRSATSRWSTCSPGTARSSAWRPRAADRKSPMCS